MSPKSKHGICWRAYFKKNFSKQELNVGIDVCRQCHRVIHKSYNEMELAKDFNSLALLIADPLLSKQFEWLSKQKIKA